MPNDCLVVCDCKGDEAVFARSLEYFAKQAGWDFRFFTTEIRPSHGFSPLEAIAQTSPYKTDWAQQVQVALGVGSGLKHNHYAVQAQRLLSRAVEKFPDASTFAKLLPHLENVDDQDLYPTKISIDQTSGVEAKVAEFAAVPALNVSSRDSSLPDDVREHVIDFERIFRKGRTVIVLHFQRFHSLVPMVCKAVFEAARKVNGELPKEEHHRVLFLADELHTVIRHGATELMTDLIDLGRASSVIPIFSTQKLSQYEATGDKSLLPRLVDVPFTLFFGANDHSRSNDLFRSEHAN